jgi:predicted TIM-barrel fold metal-dependent hydrolase
MKDESVDNLFAVDVAFFIIAKLASRRKNMTTTKIWANSGDSHFIEPEDLWASELPASLAALIPRAVKSADGLTETVYVDGKSFERRLPKPGSTQAEFTEASTRAPGFKDFTKRIADSDQEGVWSEVVYPSLGMWQASFTTRELLKETSRITNDFSVSEIMGLSPRLIPTAQIPTLDIADAVAEVERCAELGFQAAFMTVRPHPLQQDWNYDYWNPLWDALTAAQMVPAFHIGTDPIDMAAGEVIGVAYRGPGGAVMNHTNSGFSGFHAAMKLVASGVLDKRPSMKILISEGGASWMPYLADRMEEAYRQHYMAVRPKLNRSPREILYSQVFASFQHDQSAVGTALHFGCQNVMWGSDYPHLEGTWGHTQETLHELFDGIDPKVSHRIRIGAFEELFPRAPKMPSEFLE